MSFDRKAYMKAYKSAMRAEKICLHCSNEFADAPHVICALCRRKSIVREFDRQVRIACGLHTPQPRYPEAV